MIMYSLLVRSTLLVLAIMFSGCATIMKDESQPVAFSSEPDGAVVKFNSVARGKTPVTIMVKRSMESTLVSIEKTGYKAETFPLEKSLSAMTFGNIIFGGIIGIGVDAATGANTNYTDSIHVNLIPIHGNRRSPENALAHVDETNDKKNERRNLMSDYQEGKISAEEYLELSKQKYK